MGRAASPNSAASSSSRAVRRAATATRSPRSSAAIAHSRPNPFDAPVINQVFGLIRVPATVSNPVVRLFGSLAYGPRPPVKPAPFDYHDPRSVAEVVDLLAEYGEDAKALAGG